MLNDELVGLAKEEELQSRGNRCGQNIAIKKVPRNVGSLVNLQLSSLSTVFMKKKCDCSRKQFFRGFSQLKKVYVRKGKRQKGYSYECQMVTLTFFVYEKIV